MGVKRSKALSTLYVQNNAWSSNYGPYDRAWHRTVNQNNLSVFPVIKGNLHVQMSMYKIVL